MSRGRQIPEPGKGKETILSLAVKAPEWNTAPKPLLLPSELMSDS